MIRDRSLDIAVTGISARFPGLETLDQWWSSLLAGQVHTTKFDRNTLLEAGVPQAVVEDTRYIPVHGHLENADRFDNKFFKISPREAEIMDPQHRLMLEAAWSALEDAGNGRSENRPVTAVFASGSGSAYFRSMLTQGPLDEDTLEQALHGTEPDFIASFISYKLNLTGPAVAIQTACSSSLVSVHFAIQSLLNGDCDQALVVAAGIAFPQAGYLYEPGGIKSATGACRPFDKSGDGVIEGSGVACLVLQRLSDVAKSAPKPYGIILGTAVNNDGSQKAGYFAPSVVGQTEVMQAAIQTANIDISTIGYIETHGTGTHIGDPIEWASTCEAYKQSGAQPNQIAIGALKANIGHTDAAAGLAALIKALWVVNEGLIPPLTGFESMNPLLETEEAPLFIPSQIIPWTNEQPRRAGISAFGIGGTNAHVIIEQAPTNPIIKSPVSDNYKIIRISASDSEALERAAKRLKDHILSKQDSLEDIAFTLLHGRSELSERLAICGRTREDFIKSLANGIGVIRGHAHAEGPKPIIFLFPGQGSQYPGMALPFANVLPSFQSHLESCLSHFEPTISTKISQALYNANFPKEDLYETSLAQPVLFALEYAAAKSLIDIGVVPSAAIGHSLGEITAACLAGTFDIYEAAQFVTMRGNAMQACPEGKMLVVNCSAEKVEDYIIKSNLEIYIAALNAPDSCVVAGKVKDVDHFQNFVGDEVLTQPLKSNRAFHSPLIEGAIGQLTESLKDVKLLPLQMPIALNATGQLLSRGTILSEDSFLIQARNPVLFSKALMSLSETFKNATFVEVGPGRALSSMATSINFKSIPLLPNREKQGILDIHNAIATLWTQGHPIISSIFCDESNSKLIRLPTYPFFGPKWMAPEAAAGLRISSKSIDQRIHQPISRQEKLDTDSKDSSDVSTTLAKLWEELLNYNALNEHSDFFDLGGDSLLMISLVRKVNKAFNIQAPPRALLSARTLRDQSAFISHLLAT